MKENKPKIGIINFHRAINYGALLQAFALQKVLTEMGCECHILDYRSESIESKHKKFTLNNCRNLKDIGRFLLYSRCHNKKFDKFRDFSKRHINFSEPLYTLTDLKDIASKYDKFICGSDQIWNSNITDFDRAYFLPFAEERQKNSYAASFGFKNIPEKYIGDYRLLLSNFAHISVREKQGADILRDLLGKDVDVVLDPTFLISKKEWEVLTTEYKKHRNYILVYMFGRSETISKFVKNLSRKTGCEVVCISYSKRLGIKGIYEKTIGPEDFLGLFKGAKYVVTNSFHGTAFSINFNKNFFVEMLPESLEVNSRLENILDDLGLRKREIINGENKNVDEAIDYEIVNMKLDVERERSFIFLHRLIEA